MERQRRRGAAPHMSEFSRIAASTFMGSKGRRGVSNHKTAIDFCPGHFEEKSL